MTDDITSKAGADDSQAGEAPPNAGGVEENPWGDAPVQQEPPSHEALPGDTSSADVSQAGAGEEQPNTESKSSAPPPPPPEDHKDRRIRALEEIIEERDNTLREYIAAHKSEKANMEAFKNRLVRDQELELKAAATKRVESLVDVLDNLYMTANACREGGDVEALVEGVDMVAQQFLAVLETQGLRRVDPIGQPFDPTTMEAMSMVPVTESAQDNVVLSTLRPGYWVEDRELRPALVTVGRCSE